MKICIKMGMKTCFHSHFYANLMSFYEEQIKQQMLYTANILSSFKSILKWQSSSFRLHQFFFNFDDPNAFFPNSTGPWSRL